MNCKVLVAARKRMSDYSLTELRARDQMEGAFWSSVRLNRVAVMCLALLLITAAGCNQRIVGPQVEYSQSDVELIKQRIKATDW